MGHHPDGQSDADLLEQIGQEPEHVSIRWMNKRDLSDIVQIERQSFGHPWTIDDFTNYLRQRNTVALVAESRQIPCGFCVYDLNPDTLCVISIAVGRDWRLLGIGRALIDRLKAKLTPKRRPMMLAAVSDQHTEGQAFLTKMGLEYSRKLDVKGESDGILFAYDVRKEVQH